MKRFLIAALVLTATLAVSAQQIDMNVNERYAVESITLSGIDESKASMELRDDILSLTGQKFSQEKLDDLKRRVCREFPGYRVDQRLAKGEKPGYIRVVIELYKRHDDHFQITGPKGLYHSRLGWSGELDATVRAGTNAFTFGILNDGDALVERFAGIRARYENRSLGTKRVRLAFDFESYHAVWNGATVDAADFASTSGIYRNRQNFQPMLTFVIARPLTLSAGVSFERFQVQFPAAHTESANAVQITLRYDRQLEDSGANKHRLEAGYNLRAATRTFDSDYVYTRHFATGSYAFKRGAHRLSDSFLAGEIVGRAPLFERFVLGNAETLRGWNKYDIAPLGGNRVVHNSVEYRYRSFEVFYDAGSVWNTTLSADVKHSLGAGIYLGDFTLALAFPIRSGRAEPVFYAGLNMR